MREHMEKHIKPGLMREHRVCGHAWNGGNASMPMICESIGGNFKALDFNLYTRVDPILSEWVSFQGVYARAPGVAIRSRAPLSGTEFDPGIYDD